MRGSKLVVGLVVMLGVGGLGVAAFALDGGSGSGALGDPTTTTAGTVDPTTTTTVAPDTSAAPVAPSTEDPSTGVLRSTDGCDGGTYANHGDYVSSVAHNPDRAPGDVAVAAQSDCGKPVSSTTASGDETETETEPTTTEAPETEPAVPDTGSGTGHGNGSANGNGRP
jgi:hypothetical protein